MIKMKPGLEPGTFAETTITVTSDMCPHFDGILVHPLYATWTLVRDMEVTGRKLLAPFLEDHEEGVGAHIDVDHRSPAPIGSVVVVRAEVTSCSPRRLTTRVTAHTGDRLLAEGLFVQTILPKTKLQTLIDRHQPPADHAPE